MSDLLAEALSRRQAKTRCACRAGLDNKFLEYALRNGLLEARARERTLVTERGYRFLKVYKEMQELCPRLDLERVSKAETARSPKPKRPWVINIDE
jgi:predicted transcriptional regulator